MSDPVPPTTDAAGWARSDAAASEDAGKPVVAATLREFAAFLEFMADELASDE